MVPDYGLISAITLYSFGYLQAQDMARKLVMTYKLCSEQLSSQVNSPPPLLNSPPGAKAHGPLRLWHARGDRRAARRRQPEAQVCGRARGHPHAPRHHRRQPSQVSRPGRAPLPGHPVRPVPRSGACSLPSPTSLRPPSVLLSTTLCDPRRPSNSLLPTG
eukprot:745650-Prorocentrum_minimum.AAC.1